MGIAEKAIRLNRSAEADFHSEEIRFRIVEKRKTGRTGWQNEWFIIRRRQNTARSACA